MPFSILATKRVFSHRSLALRRLLFRQPRTLFVDRYAPLNGTIKPVQHDFPGDKNCPVCGFAMVRFQLSGSWTVETCSAFSLKGILGSQSLVTWVEALDQNLSPTAEERKARIPNLPTPGH